MGVYVYKGKEWISESPSEFYSGFITSTNDCGILYSLTDDKDAPLSEDDAKIW